MTLTNSKIANSLREIADILEENDENIYKIRAYRRAANSVERHAENIADMFEQQIDLTIVPYVGKKIAEIISKILTGNYSYTPNPNYPKPYPEHLQNKKRKPFFLKIYNLIPIMDRLLNQLNKIDGVEKIACAGDYRRKKEVVSDFEIIVIGKNANKILNEFSHFSSVKYIIKTTPKSVKVQLKVGIQITLHIVSTKIFGARLLHFTGAKIHYKLLKKIAEKNNMRLTQNGLFKNNINIASHSEQEIYQSLKLQYIEPELREGRGEIEAAKKNQLPKLIELSDIKGDLHCHTNETDGTFSLEEMVNAAMQKGYQYVAITDHSQSLKITHGMDEKRLLKQMDLIDSLNAKLKNFTILKSMEVDILEDGSLDLHKDVLKKLDITVCSIHSKFRIPSEKQTERILRAMDNPYFNILGHATGRLIKHRTPYEIDIERILIAAKERNCFIEVNAQPARLDINDLYCQKAKEIGVKMAISSDAHTTNGFNFMILGVNQARRGWLEAKDVINTYDLVQLRKIIKRY